MLAFALGDPKIQNFSPMKYSVYYTWFSMCIQLRIYTHLLLHGTRYGVWFRSGSREFPEVATRYGIGIFSWSVVYWWVVMIFRVLFLRTVGCVGYTLLLRVAWVAWLLMVRILLWCGRGWVRIREGGAGRIDYSYAGYWSGGTGLLIQSGWDYSWYVCLCWVTDASPSHTRRGLLFDGSWTGFYSCCSLTVILDSGFVLSSSLALRFVPDLILVIVVDRF